MPRDICGACVGGMTVSINNLANHSRYTRTPFTRRDPWTSETLFHPDDRIISSISLYRADTSMTTPIRRRHPGLSVLSLRHSLSLCLIWFLSLSLCFPCSSTLISPSVLQNGGEVTDWLSVCLSRTRLVPYSSVGLWITVRLQRLLCAQRHMCFPSKSQTEHKMSGEYKSISCLFQVFVSPSLCFSLCATSPSPLSPAVTHTMIIFCCHCAVPFPALLFSFNQPIVLSSLSSSFLSAPSSSQHREGGLVWKGIRESDRPTDASWAGEESKRAERH